MPSGSLSGAVREKGRLCATRRGPGGPIVECDDDGLHAALGDEEQYSLEVGTLQRFAEPPFLAHPEDLPVEARHALDIAHDALREGKASGRRAGILVATSA